MNFTFGLAIIFLHVTLSCGRTIVRRDVKNQEPDNSIDYQSIDKHSSDQQTIDDVPVSIHPKNSNNNKRVERCWNSYDDCTNNNRPNYCDGRTGSGDGTFGEDQFYISNPSTCDFVTNGNLIADNPSLAATGQNARGNSLHNDPNMADYVSDTVGNCASCSECNWPSSNWNVNADSVNNCVPSQCNQNQYQNGEGGSSSIRNLYQYGLYPDCIGNIPENCNCNNLNQVNTGCADSYNVGNACQNNGNCWCEDEVYENCVQCQNSDSNGDSSLHSNGYNLNADCRSFTNSQDCTIPFTPGNDVPVCSVCTPQKCYPSCCDSADYTMAYDCKNTNCRFKLPLGPSGDASNACGGTFNGNNNCFGNGGIYANGFPPAASSNNGGPHLCSSSTTATNCNCASSNVPPVGCGTCFNSVPKEPNECYQPNPICCPKIQAPILNSMNAPCVSCAPCEVAPCAPSVCVPSPFEVPVPCFSNNPNPNYQSHGVPNLPYNGPHPYHVNPNPWGNNCPSCYPINSRGGCPFGLPMLPPPFYEPTPHRFPRRPHKHKRRRKRPKPARDRAKPECEKPKEDCSSEYQHQDTDNSNNGDSKCTHVKVPEGDPHKKTKPGCRNSESEEDHEDPRNTIMIISDQSNVNKVSHGNQADPQDEEDNNEHVVWY